MIIPLSRVLRVLPQLSVIHYFGETWHLTSGLQALQDELISRSFSGRDGRG